MGDLDGLLGGGGAVDGLGPRSSLTWLSWRYKSLAPFQKGNLPCSLRAMKRLRLRLRSCCWAGVRSTSMPKPLALMSLPRLRAACLASPEANTALIGRGRPPGPVRGFPMRRQAIGIYDTHIGSVL